MKIYNNQSKRNPTDTDLIAPARKNNMIIAIKKLITLSFLFLADLHNPTTVKILHDKEIIAKKRKSEISFESGFDKVRLANKSNDGLIKTKKQSSIKQIARERPKLYSPSQ